MPLNDRQIRNAKPTEAGKKAKLFDGGGLYLEVTPAGSKIFRLKYRIDGKEKTLTIGKYPTISLSEARQAAENARRLLSDGKDPSAAKQQAKQEQKAAIANIFSNIAAEWYQHQRQGWTANHAAKIWRSFEADILPDLGSLPINEITIRQVQAVIEAVAARGALDTANSVLQRIKAVFNYAIRTERAENNPAVPLTGLIRAPKQKHQPALPREELTEFYRRLQSEQIRQPTRIAMMLIMLIQLYGSNQSGFRPAGTFRRTGRAARTVAHARQAALLAAWGEALPLDGKDPASLYLQARGIPPESLPIKAVCHHHALPYWAVRDSKGDTAAPVMIGRHPAMLAAIERNGELQGLHITYLQQKGGGWRKLTASHPDTGEVLPAKKMKARYAGALNGAAVHLGTPDRQGRLLAAEGIETALAASSLFDLPAAACLSAHGLSAFDWPPETRELYIAAEALARRAHAAGLTVKIWQPDKAGTDALDEWNARKGRLKTEGAAQ